MIGLILIITPGAGTVSLISKMLPRSLGSLDSLLKVMQSLSGGTRFESKWSPQESACFIVTSRCLL